MLREREIEYTLEELEEMAQNENEFFHLINRKGYMQFLYHGDLEGEFAVKLSFIRKFYRGFIEPKPVEVPEEKAEPELVQTKLF